MIHAAGKPVHYETRSQRRGPNLVELAVAVAILNVLAAVAVRPYLACRARAYDLYVESAVRSAAAAQQARLADGEDYASGDCTELPGYVASPGVSCTVDADGAGFTITADHQKAGVRCTWTTHTDAGQANMHCA
jgi:Tfp pilus assembly protein PilE